MRAAMVEEGGWENGWVDRVNNKLIEGRANVVDGVVFGSDAEVGGRGRGDIILAAGLGE